MKRLLLILLLLLTAAVSAAPEEQVIYTGLPFRRIFKLYQDKEQTTPVDITGWSFALTFRDKPGGTVLASCTFAITDAANGTVRADIAAATTTDLPAGRCVWDLVGRDAAGFDHYILGGTGSIRPTNSSISE